ncbi:MAG: GNAT family N-acetyltransferase [Candidatus Heimdallarchaeota archaeon]|nr:GNAT family N-acetyltransferase [Candidatus Heimdallarchaeota archaeon]
MSGALIDYLVKKYGIEYFSVVDISGNHQLDGYILAGIESSNNLYIFSLAIKETFEKQGWGSKLLNSVITKAKNNGITHINLHVEINNSTAQNLYQKFGFTRNELVKNYYGPGNDGISMELQL